MNRKVKCKISIANQRSGALRESREEGSDQFWGRQVGAEAFTEVVLSA